MAVHSVRLLIDEWRRRLIDLTRRNRLLYFRPLRSASLRIAQPGIAEVFARFVVDEDPWQFFIPEEEPAAEADPLESDGAEAVETPVLFDEPPGPAVPIDAATRAADELEFASRDAKVIRRSLSNLFRRSHTDFEERGVRILYLAFGMLHWKESDGSPDEIESPVLLVPAALHRESPRDPFQLRPTDEDILVNASLEARLRSDFRIELPKPPDNWESAEQLEAFLQSVTDLVAERGWSVEREVWLSLFSFQKLVVYQDLTTHADVAALHPLIAALGGVPTEDGFGAEIPDAETLDGDVKPDTSFLVLDADSSQLAAIEAVRRGGHLVIQGPPGTGKSQTITNLIAQSLAIGKSVLFVSEKMAALDVVYKRLQAASLGNYCLELHSARANKREVVKELYRTYRTQLEPGRSLTDEDLRRLDARRTQLNDYVRMLHAVREPLGRSLFSVLSELAGLETIPIVLVDELDAKDLTLDSLRTATDLARRLRAVWRPAKEGTSFPWFGAATAVFDPDARGRHVALVQRLRFAIETLANVSASAAKALGQAAPSSADECGGVLRVMQLLVRSPGIERGWLDAEGVAVARASAQRLNDLQTRWRSAVAGLTERYELDRVRAVTTTAHQLRSIGDTCERLISRSVPADAATRSSLLAWLSDLEKRLETWDMLRVRLAGLLGIQPPETIADLRQLRDVGALLLESGPRPDPLWLAGRDLDTVEEMLTRLRNAVAEWRGQRDAILSRYDARIFEGEAQLRADLWATNFAGWTRWLKPSYYRARSELRRFAKDGRFPRSPLEDTRAAAAHVRYDGELRAEFPRYAEVLGSWFKGLETDIDRASKALAFARRLLALVPSPTLQCIGIAVDGDGTQTLPSTVAALSASIDEWESALPAYLSLERLPLGPGGLVRASVRELRTWVRDTSFALQQADPLLSQIASAQKIPAPRDLGDCVGDLELLATIREMESMVAGARSDLRERLGHRFADLETDLGDVTSALDFAAELIVAVPNITPEIADLAARAGVDAPDPSELDAAIHRHAEATKDLARLFTEAGAAAHLAIHADAPFADRLEALGHMQTRVDEIQDWIELRDMTDEFTSLGLSCLQTALVEQLPDAEHVGAATRRVLLARWASAIFALEPALRRFKGENHEALIAEFRTLDQNHYQLGAQRVIRQIEGQRRAFEVRPGGEVALLTRQAALKRRHMPLRKLFSQMPGLLRALKPCLLMSPLSVSQFLDPELNHFDLVIFDEASQIPTHDGVCAVYRGDQLVVCGDDKQLPPTSFFDEMQWMDGGAQDGAATPQFDVFESVLDECRSVGIPVQWLEWHYRSKHESLIAFSNRRFYESRLVTFPNAASSHPRLGVEFVHVPDGVYDRSGSRDNRREAEEVVRLVIDHFNRTPQRSIGVVAFSVAQQTQIENQLELYRRQHPEMEEYFGEDRLEGFFIKNLETVQGDERDVIIFSIGYGRDRNGEFKMWLGPLNLEGGERRLNVAVTRAREKVFVVSSVRAADFDLRGTNAAGVLHLQRYLDYAERGLDALETPVLDTNAEPESPLEESVAGAIRALGYDVVHQVGCSKYRIDLGVVDPAQTGHFLLGVECDGAMYHSAYTARDRDRIRQEVLERLGWKIHRVWSPDWSSRRDTEIARLRAAIESARTKPDTSTRRVSSVPAKPAARITLRPEPTIVVDASNARPSWAVPYVVADVGRFRTAIQQAAQVVTTEGPVHIDLVVRRVTVGMGYDRASSRIREAIVDAIEDLERQRKVRIDHEFVWSGNKDFQVRVRYPTDESTSRKVEHISGSEIAMALALTAHDALSLPEDELLTQVARLLGFDRRGPVVDARLRTTLDWLLQNDTLRRAAGRIALSQSVGK